MVEKVEEELRAALEAAQHDIRKKEQFCIERYDFGQKMSAQNKDLRVLIGTMTEELGTARRSFEASKERVTNLEKTMATLQEDLASAQ